MSVPTWSLPEPIIDTKEYLTNQTLWKQTVQDTVRQNWSGNLISEPCAIQLTFSLTPERFQRVALYNLFKPTIDAISSVIFKPSSRTRKQSKWDYEDFWIMELTARKNSSSQQKAHIAISPIPRAYSARNDGLLARPVFVPATKETPPFLVANQEPTKDTLQRYTQLLNIPSSLDTSTFFGGDLRFMLKNELATDLDNHCIPTARVLSICLTGIKTSPQRLVYLHATKARARHTDEVGVHIQAWQEAGQQDG